MHVPHHGSRRHTIKTTVWDVTMPDCTVISAPLRNDGDHLPAFETLDYADFLTAGATNPLNLPCFKYEGISPWQVFNPHGAPPQIDDEDMNGMLESYTIDSESSGKYNEIDRMQQRHPAYLMMQRTVYRGMGQNYESQDAQLTYGVYSSSNDVWVTSAINGSIVFTYNGH